MGKEINNPTPFFYFLKKLINLFLFGLYFFKNNLLTFLFYTDWRLEYMTLFLRDQENRQQGKIEGKIEGRSETLDAAINFLRDNSIMNSEQIAQFKNSILNTLSVSK